jgi:dipeptidyl aminopeptidase/acylaminoacyl peptidase
MRTTLTLCLLALALTPAGVHAQPGYQKAPKSITDILDTPTPPLVSPSPTRDRLLLIQLDPYPPIADLARPMLRLAGYRIDPVTNGPHASIRITGLSLLDVGTGKSVKLDLPAGIRPGMPVWSPDGIHVAFSNTTDNGIEAWLCETATARLRRLTGVTLNGAYGSSMRWMPGSKALLCNTIPSNRGKPPAAPRVPGGPIIQESSGKPAPARTYQDLLQNPHDEDLFDYHATSQLVVIDVASGERTPLGKPGVFARVDPAPDGKHVLVVRNHRPYSYLLPASAFPKDVEVWDRGGTVVARVASLPLADQVPIDGVPTGPRELHWLPTEPATLVWAEALDGGDPRKKVPHRDELKTQRIGDEKPARLARTEHRFVNLTWGEKSSPALLSDYDRDRRHRRTFLLDADKPDAAPELLWDLSVNDRYNNPGTPLTRTLPTGDAVLLQHRGQLFLSGSGATPKGDRPFLDRFDLKTRKAQRLFHCDESAYETVLAVLNEDGSRLLTRRETPTEPPNCFVRGAEGRATALTDFRDPTPQLRGIKKQLVTYKRADGVSLSFTLYLPADRKEGERLPAIVWAYPLEYNDATTAGQVIGSPHRFTTVGSTSHLFLLTQGYAVLDGATMPVVGSPEKANDTYVEQIVSSAKAAIDKAEEMGVIDRDRVGVGGHSYGAFMTANLLAHSDLFRAGVARSGAYNRTLTPFGFQAERRTLWEAPETYLKMSPFLAAEKIKEPLLLIHGEADNNSGTFPIQSERMYQAVKGNGGTVRYVVLPHESHGYQARESVEHTLYEMVTWFDRHVKAPRR